MTYAVYYALLLLLSPLFAGWALVRILQSKEDKNRILERFGCSSKPRPPGPLFWFHGASIGESLSFLPILFYYHERYPEAHFLVTTGTKSSAHLMGKRLPSRCVHQYAPWDCPIFVKTFLRKWKPQVGFFTESDFWPILLKESSKKMPLFLLNGHLSALSFQRWSWLEGSFRDLMKSFTFIFCQTLKDLERFKALGISWVDFSGNLKFSGKKESPDEASLLLVKKRIHLRMTWVASNTHPGEEDIIFSVHRKLKTLFPGLLLILVPRHLERVREIEGAARNKRLTYECRSEKKISPLKSDVYVMDTLGETGLAYSISPLVFMGGSLVPGVGGHNILEAARFGCVVLYGPHMSNNLDMATSFSENNAGLGITDEDHLFGVLKNLLKDPSLRGQYTVAASKLLSRQGDITPLIERINPYIEGKVHAIS